MEINELRTLLTKYGVPFDQWRTDMQHKLLRHLNARLVEIRELGGTPFCHTAFAVVDVQHRLNSTLIHRLVEDKIKNANTNRVKRVRPHLGVSIKIGLDEKPAHAARRAVANKLGISDPTGIEFVTKESEWIHDETEYHGLRSRHSLLMYKYEMPADLYDLEGYVFKKDNGSKVFFKWMPVGVDAEHRVAP